MKHAHATLSILITSAVLAIGCGGAIDPTGGDEPLIITTTNDESDAAGGEGTDMGAADVSETPDAAEPDMSEPDMAPEADLPVEPQGTTCQSKEAPVQLSKTCQFEWSVCDDGIDYAFYCQIQNVAGNVFSLCNCYENGVMDEADKIVDICQSADWQEVEAIVNEECGWDLR